MAGEPHLIKKYSNRRLYDTRSSSYITLSDVKNLVLKRDEFQVVDAKSGDDLTRSVLLQIILEEEAVGAPILTSELLAHMIRLYGDATQGMMGAYLTTNIEAFTEMQAKLREQAHALYGEQKPVSQELWAPFLNPEGVALQNMMGVYVEQSKKMSQQMQEQLESKVRNMFAGAPFSAFGNTTGKDEGEDTGPSAPPSGPVAKD